MFSKLAHIPFYQKEWHGLSLKKVMEKAGSESLGKTEIYDFFYREHKKRGFVFSEGFLNDRKKTSHFIKRELERLLKNPRKLKILSIGAGLGLIEEPLLGEGFDITLQECTKEPFEYIESKKLQNPPKTIVSEDLKDVPSESFDFVYCHGVCYAMDLETLKSFLRESFRVLKKDGYLQISGDGVYFWNLLKSLLFKHDGVLWGWRRPWQITRFHALRAGFKFEEHSFLDEDFREVFPQCFLGVPVHSVPVSDFFVFKKERG